MDTINEIEAKQREERRQIREDAELFTALMASKGWARYMAMVESVAQNYHAAIMKPLESSLEVTKTEFAKGVLSGLSLASGLPNMKITEAKQLRSAGENDEE